jgi:aspergillopepsin I
MLTDTDFSIALNRVSLSEEFEDNEEAVLTGLGSVTLGGIPSNETVPVTGKNITVPNVLFNASRNGQNVSVPAYYTVPVDSWDFPGSDQLDTATPLAILDSGTTLLYAPDNVAYAFNNEIRPEPYYNETVGAYLVDCNATVPELAVTIAGSQFFFEPEDLVYAFEEAGNVCYSSVIPGGNSTKDVYIL